MSYDLAPSPLFRPVSPWGEPAGPRPLAPLYRGRGERRAPNARHHQTPTRGEIRLILSALGDTGPRLENPSTCPFRANPWR